MNINGKSVPVRFGMYAVDLILSKADNLNGLSYYSTIGLANILWAGILNWYEVKQEKVPVTFEEVYNYVEEAGMNDDEEKTKEINEVIKEFEESQPLKSKADKIKKTIDEVKKKMSETTEEESATKQDLAPENTTG